jgi:hypothetical protein
LMMGFGNRAEYRARIGHVVLPMSVVPERAT